jgi:hypothetical protein
MREICTQEDLIKAFGGPITQEEIDRREILSYDTEGKSMWCIREGVPIFLVSKGTFHYGESILRLPDHIVKEG